MRADTRAVSALGLMILIILAIIAGTVVFSFLKTGCSKALRVITVEQGTERPLMGVTVFLLQDGRLLGSAKSGLFGVAEFPVVACGRYGLQAGGGTWTLTDPRLFDTYAFPGSLMEVQMAVSPCPDPLCEGPTR